MRAVDQSRAKALAELARQALPDAGALRAFRSQGVERLATDGLPVRNEAWRFTPPNRLVAPDFVTIAQPGPSAAELPDWVRESDTVVRFVDGHSVDGAGVRLLSQAAPDEASTDDGFAALNRAFSTDGVDLELTGPGIVHLFHESASPHGISANRHRIRVSGTSVQIVEHVRGGSETLSSGVTELLLEDASVSYVRIIEGETTSRHVGQVVATIAGGSSLSAGSFVFGGHTSRVELTANLRGASADARFFGLSLLRGTSHADHHVTARHAKPHATSDQVFRSIVDDGSQSVFTGTVIVDKGAMGTDSNQLHQALLLSDDATVHARPWLEIYADDVKCAHGATVGSLDADSLFYLRQRGLTEAEARGLLMWGFATGTVAELPDGVVREGLQARVRRWLENA
ncbi:MAG: SufD family Fe-S cluster assembly protein [Myxococcota bacterium]